MRHRNFMLGSHYPMNLQSCHSDELLLLSEIGLPVLNALAKYAGNQPIRQFVTAIGSLGWHNLRSSGRSTLLRGKLGE
jgi:hypothetical protein